MVLAQMGNGESTERVEAQLARAAVIERRLGGEQSLAYAQNLMVRGKLLVSRSLYRAAIPLYEKAVALQESLAAPPLRLAETLHSLARALENANRYKEAIQAARASLALREAAAGADSREAGEGHYILGFAMERTQPAEAA